MLWRALERKDVFPSKPFIVADFPHCLGDLYKYMTTILQNADIQVAAQEARIILQNRTGHNWSDIIAHPDTYIDDIRCTSIADDMMQRLAGKPLSKIYGQQEFYGRLFHVNEKVLDPRSDSETVIDVALKRFRPDSDIRILDLGTGSGCLILTLLAEFPNAHGVATDISPDALEIARKNAHLLELDGRVEFVESNWFSAIPRQDFDLIVSNPPYIRTEVIPDLASEVRNHDPILALDGGKDGLDAYKNIFLSLHMYLKPDGYALFEIGFDQSDDIMRLGRESRFNVKHVHPDLAGQPRVAEICCGDK